MAPTIQNNTVQDKRPQRPIEKRSDLVCKVKYCNMLPDIPFDLKFLSYPFNSTRYIQYNPTSLERSYKFEILADHDLGLNIDLVNKDKYTTEYNAQMDPADEKLLEEDILAPQDSKRSRHHARSVSWLRRTEYISTEQTRFQPQTIEKVEAKVGFSIKKNFKEETLYMDRDSQMKAIEKTFEDNKKPFEKHYSKPNVHAVETLNVFPDFKNWRYPCAQVIFDSDPAPMGRPVPAQIEEMSQAMIRGVMDESGEQFVAYFLPSEETIVKRREDAVEDRQYDDDYEYEYKMAREYNWNVKSKSSKGYEENYFLIVRPDGVFYNELETRVRLSKRRQKIGVQSSSSNTRLIVRHVPINEQEFSVHKFREKQLQPYDEEEEAKAEEAAKKAMNAAKESANEMINKKTDSDEDEDDDDDDDDDDNDDDNDSKKEKIGTVTKNKFESVMITYLQFNCRGRVHTSNDEVIKYVEHDHVVDIAKLKCRELSIHDVIGTVTSKVYDKVVHCTHRGDPKKQANAAFLICAYMVIEEDWTAYQAYSILSQQNKYKYLSFRDASCLLNTEYSVTVEDCINALYKAKWYGFLNFSDFDVDEYEKYETVKFGDINWIVPSAILAFSSPHSRDYIDKSGYQIHSPAYYYKYFKENNVKHVIRLNSKKTYDAQQTFIAAANIQHTDMVFTDGTPPTDSILQSFFSVCEQYINDSFELECNNDMCESNIITTNSKVSKGKFEGAVAIHCKAGLGRTGCLIASYIMKHWPFTAVEAIAWIRICRPGSVIGAQQQWLIDKEEYLKTTGVQWREKRKLDLNKYKRFTYGVYSVKRNTSNSNTYDYIDPPSQTSISDIYKLSCNSSIGPSKECNQTKCSSVLKTKLKRSMESKDKSDAHSSNLRQKRPASKNEDDHKLKSVIKNRVIITSNEKNINKTKNTISITKSNLNVSVMGNKKIKGISFNKTISTKISPSETPLITKNESNPSYTLATVASSARSSQRLSNQN